MTHEEAIKVAALAASTEHHYVTPSRMQAAISAYLQAIGFEPVAWQIRVKADEEWTVVPLPSGYTDRYELRPLFSATPAPARDEEIERLREELEHAKTCEDCMGDFERMKARAVAAEAEAVSINQRVKFLLEDCASYIDTLHRKLNTKPLEIGIDTAILRAAAALQPDQSEAEPFGHWVKHRLSDGAFLPAVCYVPSGPDYTVIPLYTRPRQPDRAGSGDAVRVKIKPLEWNGDKGRASMGAYRVSYNVSGQPWGYQDRGAGYYAERDIGFGQLVSGPHGSPQEAEQSADRDYEQRIRCALTTGDDRPDTGKEGNHTPLSSSGWQPPEDCDGKEQLAFEAWAAGERYDMHEHPLHYLFLDPKTYAARQGWKAALKYVRELAATATEGE